MGYRDDIYRAGNIIGYSGSLQSHPTVYFRMGREFGHITQQHHFPQNVGRGPVLSSDNYWIGNRQVGGETLLVEMDGAEPIHTSRSRFTAIDGLSEGDQAILRQAIWAHPEEKRIGAWEEADIERVQRAQENHADAMAELLGRVPRA